MKNIKFKFFLISIIFSFYFIRQFPDFFLNDTYELIVNKIPFGYGNLLTNIFENNQFKIGNRSYKLEEIINELNKFPEKFSPNVLMRPLYQEHILPNLIYVGGPSELSYWLQLKESFSKSNLNFPR